MVSPTGTGRSRLTDGADGEVSTGSSTSTPTRIRSRDANRCACSLHGEWTEQCDYARVTPG